MEWSPQPEQRNSHQWEKKMTWSARPNNHPLQVDPASFPTRFYKPYFAITTDEVRDRILSALKPISSGFLERTEKNPDAYGPIWIYTTVVFMLSVCGNLSRYFQGEQETWEYNPDLDTKVPINQKIKYELGFIPVAFSIIYGFGVIVPVLASVLINIFGLNIRTVQVVCIYGYSMVSFIPAAFLATVPFWLIKWAALLYGGVSSALFFSMTLWNRLSTLPSNKKAAVIGLIGFSQTVLLLVFKFKFYS